MHAPPKPATDTISSFSHFPLALFCNERERIRCAVRATPTLRVPYFPPRNSVCMTLHSCPCCPFLAWSHVPASLVDTHSGPPSARTRLVPAYEPSGGCRPWDRITTNLLLVEIESLELDAVVLLALLALTPYLSNSSTELTHLSLSQSLSLSLFLSAQTLSLSGSRGGHGTSASLSLRLSLFSFFPS